MKFKEMLDSPLTEGYGSQFAKVKLLKTVDTVCTRWIRGDKNVYNVPVDSGTMVVLVEVTDSEVTFKVSPIKERNVVYTVSRKGFFDNVEFLPIKI